MPYLEPLGICRSPAALKRPDRSKQCHCLQFAQTVTQGSDLLVLSPSSYEELESKESSSKQEMTASEAFAREENTEAAQKTPILSTARRSMQCVV